ncbi:MAG: topoisomerase IV, partial [Clostridiales bacterium]|nr:topoisomerase IV [Clostridiales bacterium]
TKASVLGDYLPAKLGMDEGEQVVFMCDPKDYSGNLLFVFENGKAARVELKSYETKANRKRLTGAYSDKSRLVKAFDFTEDIEIVLYSTENRALALHTSRINPKTTRNTQGVSVMTLKAKYKVRSAALAAETNITDISRYRVRTIPAAGARLKDEDMLEKQITFEEQP